MFVAHCVVKQNEVGQHFRVPVASCERHNWAMPDRSSFLYIFLFFGSLEIHKTDGGVSLIQSITCNIGSAFHNQEINHLDEDGFTSTYRYLFVLLTQSFTAQLSSYAKNLCMDFCDWLLCKKKCTYNAQLQNCHKNTSGLVDYVLRDKTASILDLITTEGTCYSLSISHNPCISQGSLLRVFNCSLEL